MNNRERWMTSNDPAWMLSALGDAADERRCKILVEECRKKWDGPLKRNWNQNVFRWKIVAKASWINPSMNERTNEWMTHLMRCIWSSPFIEREREECLSCNGCRRVYSSDGERLVCCPTCHGKGDLGESTIINPRWRTPLVIELARQVRGEPDAAITCGGQGTEYLPIVYSNPNPELMPILSDALQDAGCDVPEIIEHLQCGAHVAGECWVIGMLLDAERESTIIPSC